MHMRMWYLTLTVFLYNFYIGISSIFCYRYMNIYIIYNYVNVQRNVKGRQYGSTPHTAKTWQRILGKSSLTYSVSTFPNNTPSIGCLTKTPLNYHILAPSTWTE